MSRPQFHVATSISCCDLVSAHSGIFQVATPKIQVAISLLPSQNSPGRDLKNGVATPISIGQPELGRDIKLMSRHQMSSAPCDAKNKVAKLETYYSPARSRRQLLIATLSPTRPGRDLNSMLRPQISPDLQRFFFFWSQPSQD